MAEKLDVHHPCTAHGDGLSVWQRGEALRINNAGFGRGLAIEDLHTPHTEALSGDGARECNGDQFLSHLEVVEVTRSGNVYKEIKLDEMIE